jgi:hypothetical protein
MITFISVLITFYRSKTGQKFVNERTIGVDSLDWEDEEDEENEGTEKEESSLKSDNCFQSKSKGTGYISCLFCIHAIMTLSITGVDLSRDRVHTHTHPQDAILRNYLNAYFTLGLFTIGQELNACFNEISGIYLRRYTTASGSDSGNFALILFSPLSDVLQIDSSEKRIQLTTLVMQLDSINVRKSMDR